VKRWLLFPTLFLSAGWAQVDLKSLVKQSVDNYNRDWREAMSWAYTQTDVTRADDGKQISVSEVVPLDGTPYERMISKNGEPLEKSEQRKENHKYEKTVKERGGETSAERQERIQKYEKSRAFVNEVPDAYDFKLLGEEPVNGRPAWVVELKPSTNFVPESPHAALLRHIEGKLWIDKQDTQWAKAEARVIDAISFGFILARIGPGAHIDLDQTRISDHLWLPKQITINGFARVLMFHDKDLAEQIDFSGYHRETTSSAASAANRQSPAATSLPPEKSFR
jgi:hypothetical protein